MAAGQYILFVALSPIALLLCAAIVLHTWLSHRLKVTIGLFFLVLCGSGWLAFNILEVVSGTPEYTHLWATISYPFIALTPLAWLLFALEYTNRKSWLKLWVIVIASIVPLLTAILGLTNSQHDLIWTSTTYIPIESLLILEVEHGLWFWVHLAYAYACIMVGSVLIIQQSIQAHRYYRNQSRWLLAGGVLPIILNAAYVFTIVPGWTIDYTAVGFVVSALLFTLGLRSHQLFDISPVARNLVVERMKDGVIVLDDHNRVMDINPAAINILHIENNDPIGESMASTFQHLPHLIMHLEHPQDTPLTLLTQTGMNNRAYDLDVSPLVTPQGDERGRILVLHDITEHQAIETMLRKQTRDLEKRTAELDAFAHTVAHGLKNPLGMLMGFVNLLELKLKGQMDEGTQETFEYVFISADRMTRIINGILLLNSVARREDAPIDGVDMSLVVAEALSRTETMQAEAHAEITQSDNWPEVMGFQPWLEELWTNYLTNALKYAGDAARGIPPRIVLGWEKDARQGMLRFYVRDNGPGLSEEQQRQLFTEFTRLEKVQGEGHGLGLSIVRQITEKLGGHYGVHCPEDGGSIFWFTMPEKQTTPGD